MLGFAGLRGSYLRVVDSTLNVQGYVLEAGVQGGKKEMTIN